MNGQLMNAIWFCARNHVRAQMKEQGIRVYYVEQRDLHRAADALLKQPQHWERFLAEAQALCAKIESNAQRRKQPKSKASVVQKSGSKVEA